MNLRALVCAFLIPSLAFAEEPLPTANVVTFPPGDDNIVAVKKGEAAPFAGQLFDENTALRWAMWLQQYKLRYGQDMLAERASCAVRIEHEKALHVIDNDRASKEAADLRARLLSAEKARLQAEQELRDRPFWKEPVLWYAVGVLSAGVLAVVVEERK